MGGETRRALALQKSKAIRNMRQLNTSLTDRRRVSSTTARNFFLQGLFLLHNFGLVSPRSHERGPVEAFDSIFYQRGNSRSPRSHERGPVEASGGEPQQGISEHLRALTSAAPLKLPGDGPKNNQQLNLRALTSAAPLKQLGRHV